MTLRYISHPSLPLSLSPLPPSLSSHPSLFSLPLSFSLPQDEHGADAADSEELAAAKAVLDEVEPMLEV